MPVRRMRDLVLASCAFAGCMLLLPLSHSALAQSAPASGVITGRIVDLQTGEPLAHATISLGEHQPQTSTNADGRFTLSNIPAGSLDLRIFAVGYGMLRRRIDVAPGAPTELDIRLGQAAVRDEQHITVNAGPFDPVVPEAATQYSMNARELDDLSTLLAHDPFRAIGALPGVTANQELYAVFAVRGANLAHIGVFVDGVLVDHPAYGLEDSGNIGSLSVVNEETLRSTALLSGAFPPSYGDRTGAILDFATREGSHDRVVTRALADMIGATVTSEGPLGKAKRASWLVSGRQSYLGYMLQRLGYANQLTANYNDIGGRLSAALNEHHNLSLFSTLGSSSAEQSPYTTGGEAANFFTNGAGQHSLSRARWDWIASPHALLSTQGSWTYDHEHDTNQTSAINLDTTANAIGLRSDLVAMPAARDRLIGGVEMRTPSQQRSTFTLWNFAVDKLQATLQPLDHYTARAWQTGAYAEDTHTFAKGLLALSGGLRWQHFTPAAEDLVLPHASALLRASPSTTVSLAYGQYAQMPSLQQLHGAFGNPALHAERATHEAIGIDQRLSEKTRLHVELYNRQEHGDIDSPQTEFRLSPAGTVLYPTLGPVLANSLKSYARGVEVMLQRRSANRLSGWITWSHSYSKFWQPGVNVSFAGNDDQRDTFTAYAAYPITRTLSLSSNVRYGSGTPLPGYFAPSTVSSNGSSTTWLLSSQRNTVREEAYFDSSLRANKVFTTRHFNLTVHGEMENLTSHVNWRYYNFVYLGNIATSKQVSIRRNSTLPFLPTAGFTFEF